jgi:hypothetical protein
VVVVLLIVAAICAGAITDDAKGLVVVLLIVVLLIIVLLIVAANGGGAKGLVVTECKELAVTVPILGTGCVGWSVLARAGTGPRGVGIAVTEGVVVVVNGSKYGFRELVVFVNNAKYGFVIGFWESFKRYKACFAVTWTVEPKSAAT